MPRSKARQKNRSSKRKPKKVRVIHVRRIVNQISRPVSISEKERQIAESLIDTGNYKLTGKRLNLSLTNLRTTTFRLRSKYVKAKRVIETLEELEQRSRKMHGKKYFTA